MRSHPRLLVGITAMLACLMLTGCVGLPTQGRVVEVGERSATDEEQVTAIDAEPPRPRAPAAEIAKGFLDAMQAWPIQTDVARQFLTEAGAAAWTPQNSTIVYDDAFVPRNLGSSLRFDTRLSGAIKIDSRGSYVGALPSSQQQLNFDIVLEDGEYRIESAPNALIVPANLFAQRYRQASVYFFDRTGRILVPEPIYVPRGDQLSTTLIAALLQGPGPALRRVVQSAVPTGFSVGLSVTVDGQGVAEIVLAGDAQQFSGETVKRSLAQLAWTLRQDQSVRSIRLVVEGEDIPLPGGVATYPVDSAEFYDPNGLQSSELMFGLREGLLVSGTGAKLTETDGPFGATDNDLRSIGVNLNGNQVAGVTKSGGRILLAPIGSSTGGAQVRRVLAGTNLLPPQWDFSERIWTVDRTRDGALVRYVEAGQVRTLNVAGVSGRAVRSFLVSRDATRFVAVVRGRNTDELRSGRIAIDNQGRVSGATSTTRIRVEDADPMRVSDLTWTSPTAVSMLSRVGGADLSEVRSVEVGGATSGADLLTSTLSGQVRGLAGTPLPGGVQYAIRADGVVDLANGAETAFASEGRITSVTYVG